MVSLPRCGASFGVCSFTWLYRATIAAAAQGESAWRVRRRFSAPIRLASEE